MRSEAILTHFGSPLAGGHAVSRPVWERLGQEGAEERMSRAATSGDGAVLSSSAQGSEVAAGAQGLGVTDIHWP